MRSIALVVPCMLMLCVTAGADVLHLNFDPNDPTAGGGGTSIYGPPGSQGYHCYGVAFTTPSDGPYALDSIDLVLFGDGAAIVSLCSDDNGLPNNASPLTYLILTPAAPPETITSADFGQSYVMVGDTKYWVLVEKDGSDDNSLGWTNATQSGENAYYCGCDDTESWGTSSTPWATQVTGTMVVPEPSTLVLLSLGGISLLLRRGREDRSAM